MIDSGRRRREPANIQNTFNQINKHNRKAAAPHGRLPHTKHKLKPRPGPLSSSTVVTPHLTLPKLLRGTRDRWAVQVSFITNYSTARPTRHIPPSPLAGRGVPTRLRSIPPVPPLPGGARQGGRGVPGGKDRRGERKGDGRMRSDRDERGERGKKKKSRSGSRTHCRSVLNQLSGSLAVPCDGTGHLWWTARCSSASWRTAVAPPVEGSRQRVPRSLLLPKHGGWQQASASRRTGRLLRSLSDDSHPSSTQEHGSESSVPPVLLLLQHHRFGQPLAVSATSCCPISSAPRSPSAARALWQRVPPSSRASAPM